MDRISALRNVEQALREFEDGEIDLATAERRVRAVLRTYATEFEDPDRAVYRAVDDAGEQRVVIAASEPAARERLTELIGEEPDDVERLE